jgi:hypothetical protein
MLADSITEKSEDELRELMAVTRAQAIKAIQSLAQSLLDNGVQQPEIEFAVLAPEIVLDFMLKALRRVREDERNRKKLQ